MIEIVDSIDTMILYLLNDKGGEKYRNKSTRQSSSDGVVIETPLAHNIKPIEITCPLTTLSRDRLYTLSPELLIKDPAEIHGDHSEVALLCEEDNSLKCVTYKRTEKRFLKRYVHLYPEDSILYEYHFKKILESGKSDYWAAPIAWSPSRKKLFHVFRDIRQRPNCNDTNYMDTFIGSASIIEDSILFWIVKVQTANKGISVYADEEAIKELCVLRDAPKTPTGRLKPILHWVSKHLRRTQKNPEGIEIESHLRGCTKFNLDDYDVSITNPCKK